MKNKPYLLFTFFVFIGLLAALWAPLTGSPTALAATPITNQEYARNGDFSQDKTGWNIVGISSGVFNNGQDGGPALVLEGITENQTSAYQQVHLPSTVTAATLAFDYRLLYPDFPSPGTSTLFEASVTTHSEVIANVVSVAFNGDSGWLHVEVPLSAQQVADVQTKHASGERIFIFFYLYQEPANVFKAYVDNVSLKIDGSMDEPNLSGSIAYVGIQNGYDYSVKRLAPDGSGLQTLWTHPGTFPSERHIYDVDWKPDASELAFSSNHEWFYSAFHADIYGIQPNGNGLRRISNPPSKAAVDAGQYPTGTVTGKIHNNYGSSSNLSAFVVYIEGSANTVPVEIGNLGDETGFTLPKVADLGSGLQTVVFTWSNADSSCVNGKEFAAAVVDVQAGQSVDAGTIDFNGGTCGRYNSESLTWKRDGNQIGASVVGPRKFLVSGQAIGTELFSNALSAQKLAWSPVNDQILYFQNIGDQKGIYLTTAGGGTGTYLVDTGYALWVATAWLPDGSGFVYTADNAIYEYTLASSQSTLLTEFYNEFVGNPSLSPDGKYIVFERQSTGTPAQYNLWIMDRTNPVMIWPLTTDGNSYNPDWSHVDPPTITRQYIYLPMVKK